MANNVPPVPLVLSATGTFRPGGAVTLTSSKVTDADGDTVYYHYQYTTDGGQSWSTIATVALNERTFNIPTSITSNFIQFRVRTFDGREYSGYRTSSEYTVVYNTAPTAPTAVFVTGNPTHLTTRDTYTLNIVGATDVDGDELRHYISISKDAGETWQLIASVSTNTFNYVVAPEVFPTVTFRVRTYDGSVYSPYRSSATYTINSKATVSLISPIEGLELNEGDTFTLSGTANDADTNQAVMVYCKVEGSAGMSGERIIATANSGEEFSFSKVFTFKNNNIYDGTTLVASKIVSEGNKQGTAKIHVEARDNIGTSSIPVVKTLTFKPNQNPTISLDTSAITLKEGAKEKVVISSLDTNLDVVSYKVNIRGNSINLTVPLGTSDGINPLTSEFTISSKGSIVYFTGADGIEKKLSDGKINSGTYYLDVYAVDEFEGTSDVKTITLGLTANRKPILTVSNPPSIVISNSGVVSFTGNVSDLDDNDKEFLTLGVRINGGNLIPIPFDEAGDFKYDYSSNGVEQGIKSFIFTANDQKELTTVTRQFEVVTDEILFEFKKPIETDIEAHKVSIILGYKMSDDATLKVEMCNNGFDVNPTWEDVTANAMNGVAYSFLNKTKTASKWGINIRVELVKNSAPTVYVDRIGILFE